MKPVLEVCAHSVESAVSAERGGAMRLELCANLMIGGTSPDEDLFRMVRERVSVPVRVLLRPRCGDFLYTESEFELLCRQVKRFAALGADGIVIGVLRMQFRRENVPMGLPGLSEFSLWRCDENAVRAAREAFDACCGAGQEART